MNLAQLILYILTAQKQLMGLDVMQDETHVWKLNLISSVSFAEQYAVRQALMSCYIRECPQKIVIVTDTLSLTQALGKVNTVDPVIKKPQINIV